MMSMIFWLQKNFVSRKTSEEKKNFQTQKDFKMQKCFVSKKKKKIWTKQKSGTQQIFEPKKWKSIIFGTKILLGPTKIFETPQIFN